MSPDLLGKLTGSGKASDESAFKAGSGGMLETGGEDMLSLGGSGLQEKVTELVCDLVLKHAQSLFYTGVGHASIKENQRECSAMIGKSPDLTSSKLINGRVYLMFLQEAVRR